MSIVERAAKRLGTVAKTDPKLFTQDETTGARAAEAGHVTVQLHEPPLIERTTGTTRRQLGPQGSDAIDYGDSLAASSNPAVSTVARTRNDARFLNLPLKWLRQRNMVTPEADRSPIAESFRRIKRHILANIGKPGTPTPSNLVMVTSALPGEGKTFCAINLAISIAMEMDQTVLLIDADTVRPSVLPALGLDQGLPGLMDILGDPSIAVMDVIQSTNIEKLSILPAGSPHRNVTEMLASETMRALVRELAEHDDRIVIFDSPPLLVSSEASVLATHMSQIVVVVAAGETTEAALRDALKRVEGCGTIGLLLNKGRASSSGYYGYDGYS